MEKKKSDKIKNLIIVFALILLIIALIVFFILINKKSQDKNPVKNEVPQNEITNNINNTTKSETTNNTTNTNTINDVTNSANTSNLTDLEKAYTEKEKSLKKVTDMKTYFLIKNLLTKYYASNDFENPLDIIGKEAIKDLNITKENYRKYNDFDAPIFRIYEIYEQR